MRLARLETDYWELKSAEELHRQYPDTFWIPSLEQRQNLKRGDAAKLIFDIAGQDSDGIVSIQCEKMWVVVAGKENGCYIGVLHNQPASVESSDDVYLCFGAEIPFLPEHISDITRPPSEYVEWQFRLPPKRM